MAHLERTVVCKARNPTSIPIEHQAMISDIQLVADYTILFNLYQINENTFLNTYMRYLMFLISSSMKYFNINTVKLY